MGRFKKIRLNKLFSLCLISCLVFNATIAKANVNSNALSSSKYSDDIMNIGDINNNDSLGNTYTINAKVICVYDDRILVNDDTGEIWIYLDNITVDNIEIENDIFAIGTLTQVNDKIVLSVNDANNIGLLDDSTDQTPDTPDIAPEGPDSTPEETPDVPSEDPDVPEDTTPDTPSDDIGSGDNSSSTPDADTSKPDDSTGSTSKPNANTNTQNPGTSTSKPDTNTSNKPVSSTSNNSSAVSKPNSSSSSTSNDKTSSGNNSTTNDVYTGPIIKAQTPIEITYDLSSAEWDEIKAAYEAKYIKIKDLPSNKLRITQVSAEYGDKIWIVNDPRMLDAVEEETVFSVGTSLIESLDYTAYDISENVWYTIYNDVKSGSAKLKTSTDDSLLVRYPSSNGSDSTITINKK